MVWRDEGKAGEALDVGPAVAEAEAITPNRRDLEKGQLSTTSPHGSARAPICAAFKNILY